MLFSILAWKIKRNHESSPLTKLLWTVRGFWSWRSPFSLRVWLLVDDHTAVGGHKPSTNWGWWVIVLKMFGMGCRWGRIWRKLAERAGHEYDQAIVYEILRESIRMSLKYTSDIHVPKMWLFYLDCGVKRTTLSFPVFLNVTLCIHWHCSAECWFFWAPPPHTPLTFCNFFLYYGLFPIVCVVNKCQKKWNNSVWDAPMRTLEYSPA